MNTQDNEAIALVKQGIQLTGQQRFYEALASFDNAVALKPDFAEAWIARGIVLFGLQRFEDAVASYDRVLALKPDAQAFNCRGTALYSLDRLDEALASYDNALALKPDAQAFNRRGLALHKLGRFDEALASYDSALALKPDYAEALNSRGAALAKLERFDQALASIDQAIALRAGSAEACLVIGAALGHHGRHDDALACYDRALAFDPDHADVRFHRALALLSTGDFVRGFADYRWRFRIEDEKRRPARPDFLTCPDWEGEPIAGKRLVIFVEQGYGDALQFVRYVPMAVALGAQVTLFTPLPLLKLLRASLPGVEVVDRLPDTAVFDFQAPMLCLPRIFGTTLDTLPAQTPYLTADPAAAAAWARRLAALPGLKVGLVWAGSSRLPDIDARRSLRLSQFAPLAAIANLQCISLQLGEPAEEAKTPPAGLELADWTDEIRDYADTAALIAGLDLVITVDTSVAHLAGGLGKPVWILSRYDGCWRWLQGREDSPWYPSARLFRQPAPGAWEPVIANVATALRAFSSKDGGLPAANPHPAADATALVKQGLELAGQRRFDQALASFEQAIALKPDFAEAWIVRGIVLFDLRRFEDAVASYDRVLALKPDAEAFNCRGAALYNLGRLDEAVASYDNALALKPDADAFNTRGAALYKLDRFDEALASYDSALALKPDAEIFTRRGAALYDLGRFDAAVASYDSALALKPDYAEALNSRGAALENLGRHDQALASYDRALALKPDHAKTHWNRSLALLRSGDLKRGFEAYRWRFQANDAPPTAFTCPGWEGESLAGKRLVIFHEQGYGDTLQFIRYVPMAVARGAQVTLLVPQTLIRLLRASLPGIEVTDRLPDTVAFDFQAPMLCLPRIFGTTLDTIPAQTPYLVADRAAAAVWAQRLAALPGRKVGLVWAGGKKVPTVDARRSLKLAQLAPLAAIADLQFISLQLGEPAEEAKALSTGLELIDWTGEISDYADTAALIASLDLVITVDTSVAHLAGALGRPVWILSRYDGCWRWLMDREDSPWYPTARLFHQPAMGEWEPVVANLAAALQALSSKHAAPGKPTTAIGEPPIETNPHQFDDAVALVNHGVQLAAQRRFDEALADFDKAIALKPDLAEAANNRGAALYNLGRLDEAVASYDHALALKPDAEVFGSRGLALHTLGRLDEALASYDSALALKPDYAETHYNRALTLLRAGDLARGFQAYRWRFRINGTRPALACPDWEGEPIAGKRLVIFHEQGAGDTLQFVRYVPMAVALGAQVTLLVPPALAKLLRASLPGVEVVDRVSNGTAFDFQAPMLCLPSLFGTTLDTVPAQTPYLTADPAAAAAWAQRLAALPGLKAGLVWAGSAKPASYDGRRSLKLAQFAPLAAIADVQFVSLQLGEPAEETKASSAGLELADWTDEIRDYADTAALIAGLDLVITVDTSVAHLAGGLGKPVWILSRYDGCWRWLLNREDSPWYPSARLFHQPAMGKWEPVISDLAAALQAFASKNQAADAIALVKQGIQLTGQQRFHEALASFDNAVALKPDFAEAWIARGIVLFGLQRFEDAVASYDRVLALKPDAQAFNCRGTALYSLDRLDEALASYDNALALKPDAQAFNRRGLALHKLGRFDEALASYDSALALKPDYAEALNSRGAALAKLERFDQALASIDQAITLRAGSAEVCQDIGIALHNLERLDEALACYDRALTLNPDNAEVRFHRALALLSTGDFVRGFADYRWRFRIEDEKRRLTKPDFLTCPDWEGEPIAGKRLVIFHEQGYGDTLQFVRYVPMAVARGAQVTLLVPQTLLRLLRASLPGIEVTDRVPDTAVFDFQAPMLCLPRIFGTTLDTLPAQTPYLTADPAAAAAWARRLAALPGLKVGLVWAGGKKVPTVDARRSLRLSQFAPLAAIANIQCISLQLGEPAEEAKTPPAGLELADWTDEIRDYADTAALIAGLDLVITVDTSVAHLAGGLGKPVWILSRYDGCWRWLQGREDSPWYPSARLFRQPAPGAWEPVIASVAAALQPFSAKNA